MSNWTGIYGVLDVDLRGYAESERDLVIQEIIEGLPKISGSNGECYICINKKATYKNCNSYFLIMSGKMRDKILKETRKETEMFLEELSKKLWVNNVLISVTDWKKERIYKNALKLRTNYKKEERDEINKGTEKGIY